MFCPLRIKYTTMRGLTTLLFVLALAIGIFKNFSTNSFQEESKIPLILRIYPGEANSRKQ